jgi:hypothetical protein
MKVGELYSCYDMRAMNQQSVENRAISTKLLKYFLLELKAMKKCLLEST